MADSYDRPGNKVDDDFGQRFGVSPEEERAMEQPAYDEEAERIAQREGLLAQENGSDSARNSEGASQSADQLRSSEEEGDSNSMYNPQDAGKRRGRFRSKAKGLLKHKWLIGGAAIGSGGLIIIILLLLFFLGSMKLQDLAEHITEYQFARVARNYSEHASSITEQEIDLSTTSDSRLTQLAKQFQNVKDNTWGSMWEKINNYRPEKIVEKLQEQGSLDFKYTTPKLSNLWSKKLTAIVINGEEIPVYNSSLWNKAVHPIGYRNARLQFSTQVNNALYESMQGRSTIIRGLVAKSIRDQLGIKLKWWNQAKYNGKTEEEANALEEQDSAKAIDNTNTAPSAVPDVENSAQQAQDALQECIDSTSCLDGLAKSGGKLPGPVFSAISAAVKSDIFQKALGFLNPVYAIGLPVCMIYDGSLQSGNQGQVVDNQNAELQRTYYSVATAADQQKSGETNGEAVGAMNWKVGDVENSIPEERASGFTVDTGSGVSPQSSATGQLNNTADIFSSLPSPLNTIGSDVAGSSCQYITNLELGAVIAVGNIVAGFFTGESSTVAENGLANALAAYIRTVVTSALSKKELLKLGLTTAGVAALTIYAQQLVAQKASVTYSGIATGSSFDNDADAGGNLNANETGRRYYGRPLTYAEIAESQSNDQNYQNSQLSQASTYQRYFAISNPDSLITRLGLTIHAHLSMSLFSSFISLTAKILNPLDSLVHTFGSLNSSVAMAAASTDNHDYGIVQWGWSNQEESLIQNDPSYQPLQNEQILTSSMYNNEPAEQYIAEHYNFCWAYDSTGNTDPSKTMGWLLTNQKIQRDNSGDLTAAGDCSPSSLGLNNPDSTLGNLIFRYRLEKNYQQTVDQLESVQNAS